MAFSPHLFRSNFGKLKYIVSMARLSTLVGQNQSLKLKNIHTGGSPGLQGLSFFGTMPEKLDNLLSDARRHFDYETLISKKNDGAVLIIDVRQPEELSATGVIPESINVPLADLQDALEMTPDAFRIKYGVDMPSKEALIVFSCQSGRRSVTALGKALALDYLNAANYKGGWLDWQSHKNPRRQ